MHNKTQITKENAQITQITKENAQITQKKTQEKTQV